MPDQKHVVAVNDTEEILELFRDIIEGLGHRATLRSYAPHDGAEVARLRPDLVIIDFVIGGRELEGWQLIQKLRMQRETERVPIIACTGAVSEVREMEGHLTSAGVKVVFKPFTVAQLEMAIGEALQADD